MKRQWVEFPWDLHWENKTYKLKRFIYYLRILSSDTSSLAGEFRSKFPDPVSTSSVLDLQQQAYLMWELLQYFERFFLSFTISVIIFWNTSRKYNINLVVHKYTYCVPPLPSMLFHAFALDINVFHINIERKGKEKLASVSTTMTGIVG